jgi:drug/metabolite transporter (DMT)-like permease
MEATLFLPLAIWGVAHSWSRLGWLAAVCLIATGILHLFYTESLIRGYRVGDLSLVYPVARGTGPLLSFLGAILFLHECPSLLAGAGTILVTGGIWLLCEGVSRRKNAWPGLCWGVATGLTIACYTLVDAYSVKVLLLSPVIVEYAGNLFRMILLSGPALRRRSSFVVEFHQCWKEALGIAMLTPVGYILVLFAMRIAPVSHIAPAREMSMLIGAYFGVRFLSEGHLARRLAGSALIVGGVAALTVG